VIPARRSQPSLRRRLMLNMLLPAAALAAALGVGGWLMIRGVVEAAHDRLLDGSVLAIAERLTVDEDNEVTVDLPPVALGMLESQAHDSIYYNLTYDGTLVTGYQDLPRPQLTRLAVGETKHWDAVYRGSRIRIAAQLRRVFGKPNPILVEVAETTNARRAIEYRMLAALGGLELGLLALVGWLTWRGIGRGLEPLAALGREIDARSVPGAINLKSLNVSAVPREALPPAVALNALLERLEQSIGAIRRFTADASHQMRTPLTILRTHLGILQQRGIDTPEGRAALEDIEGATRRFERLLAQLLALARADESGSGEDETETVDLARIAAAVVAERVPQAIANGVDIQFEGPEEPVPIASNEILTQEIVANLVDNAIRYNREGGAVIVRVMAAESGGRLEVEDEGPGIPATDRARVFERFYRIPRRGGPEGSGLGLAIVRALADRLGADVRLQDGKDGTGLLTIVHFRGVVANVGPRGDTEPIGTIKGAG
jgi:two-component system, OmpR family, sensor histidine kinase TctE